ncbi:hypothetical protein SVAN01_11332 [Stagonosporopsis vannaccii]|nr:hypothetical protein SVAN01_11332 [Stagonosporopsis vannaccii]
MYRSRHPKHQNGSKRCRESGDGSCSTLVAPDPEAQYRGLRIHFLMYVRHAKGEKSCVSSETLRLVIPPIQMELAVAYMSTALVATSVSKQLLFLISTHSGTRPVLQVEHLRLTGMQLRFLVHGTAPLSSSQLSRADRPIPDLGRLSRAAARLQIDKAIYHFLKIDANAATRIRDKCSPANRLRAHTSPAPVEATIKRCEDRHVKQSIVRIEIITSSRSSSKPINHMIIVVLQAAPVSHN